MSGRASQPAERSEGGEPQRRLRRSCNGSGRHSRTERGCDGTAELRAHIDEAREDVGSKAGDATETDKYWRLICVPAMEILVRSRSETPLSTKSQTARKNRTWVRRSVGICACWDLEEELHADLPDTSGCSSRGLTKLAAGEVSLDRGELGMVEDVEALAAQLEA